MRNVKGMFAIIVAISFILAGKPVLEVSADNEDLVVVKGIMQGTIDGAAAGDAYSDPVVLSNGLGSFRVQTYRHPTDGTVEEEIQFLFTIDDNSNDVGDVIRIYFDLDHNHAASDPDRGIVINRNPAGVTRTTVNLFGPPTVLGNLPSAQWQIDTTATNWTAEVKIRASDLNLNFIPSLMGIFVQGIDVETGLTTTGNYPETATLVNVNSWDNLKTRNPLEYVLVLDQSGSMLRDFDGSHPTVTTQRWQAAKAASDIFTQIFYAFRSGEDSGDFPYFEDKIGLATYYWLDAAPMPDHSAPVKPLTLLNEITVDGYVDRSPAPVLPVFGQHTPIKRGVDVGMGMFEAADAEKVIILLSDGIHDRPTTNYNAVPYVFPAGMGLSDYQVNTVALGPDGSVGTQLLEAIKDDFGGFGASYISALQQVELIDAFVESLFSQLYLNRVNVNTLGQFQVNDREPRLLVMLVWHSVTAMDRGFRIRRPDNTIINTTDPSYHHFKNNALQYEIAYYVLDFPSPSGTWQTIALGSSDPQVGDNTFALFDPTVYAYPDIAQDGEDFILRVALKEDGVPITQAMANVVVDVSTAEEGLGTYASTVQSNCKFAPPTLPGRKEFDPREPLLTLASSPQQIENVEPLPPHFAKVQALFLECGKEGLDRGRAEALQLYDDGTNGDAIADDGIFTLRFTDTQYEGTYTFHFTASGVTPQGSDFTRTRTLSAHKSVNVLPETTIVESVELFTEGNIKYVEYYIIPCDRNNEYLGPGHVGEVEFLTNRGEWITAVNDYNNGIYSRILQYERTQGEPQVIPVVQGKPIPIRPLLDIPWQLCLLLILLLLIIIILLVFYVWRLRKKKFSP
jgi:hypothetical protein